MNHSPEPRGGVLPAARRVLEFVALAAVVRTLFLASADAFACHVFGDPRPEQR